MTARHSALGKLSWIGRLREYVGYLGDDSKPEGLPATAWLPQSVYAPDPLATVDTPRRGLQSLPRVVNAF